MSSFTSGALGGAKLAMMFQDYRQQKLANAEINATRAHRDLMRGFEEEKSKGENQLQAINAQLLQEQLSQTQTMFPLEIEGKKQALLQGEENIQNTRTERDRIKAGIKKTEADTEGQVLQNRAVGLGLAQEVGKGVGTAVTKDEVDNFASQLMESIGMKNNKPGSAEHQVYSRLIGGQINKIATDTAELKQQNAEAHQQHALETAYGIADAAMRTADPNGVVESLTDSLANGNPMVKKIAGELVRNNLQSRDQVAIEAGKYDRSRTITPGEEARQKIMGDRIGMLQARTAMLGSKEKLTSDEKKQLVASQKELDSLLGASGEPGPSAAQEKKAPKPSKAKAPATDKSSGLPIISSQAEYDALKPGTRYIDSSTGRAYTKG